MGKLLILVMLSASTLFAEEPTTTSAFDYGSPTLSSSMQTNIATNGGERYQTFTDVTVVDTAKTMGSCTSDNQNEAVFVYANKTYNVCHGMKWQTTKFPLLSSLIFSTFGSVQWPLKRMMEERHKMEVRAFMTLAVDYSPYPDSF